MDQTNPAADIEITKVGATAWPAPPAKIGPKPSRAVDPLVSLFTRRGVPVAYLAGQFPVRSETFVYREIRALRDRGWDVLPVVLHDVATGSVPGTDDLVAKRTTVYGKALKQTIRGAVSEFVNFPTTTLGTLSVAVADAIHPGETTDWKSRARLLAQAVAGIGLADRLRSAGVNHVHCHFAHAPSSVGMYTAAQLGVGFSFTGHANDLFQRRTLLKRKLQRASFVSCISRWHREFYRSISPADDSVYPVIRCGVDSESWTPRKPRLLGEVMRVLTVCRLVEKKGVDKLIRELAGWKTRFGWKLTVAGDGPERENLGRLVDQLGVTDHVDFLGAVDNERVRSLLSVADVFALACRVDSAGDKDGVPVVLMEAMACGVPVVAGDLPAIRELVEPEVSGLLVNPDRPGELAAAFERLSSDAPLRDRLSVAGRAVVAGEFDLNRNVDRLERVLERTVRSSRGSSEPNPMSESNDHQRRRYALITPCRDEAKYARRTLDSVTSQTVTPAVWVIVDDGSKDETPQILAEYAAKFPWIKVVTRADRGDRKLGGGVIDAFYAGYDTLNPDDFDYVCKLDLDLDLPVDYFENLMRRMEQNPRIGTASGKPYFTADGKTVDETCGDENSVGMIKFYRTECFKQIKGFVRELMWDGIDCHRCRQKGWIAVSWPDQQLRFEHLRPMGTSHKNWWTGRVRHGVGQYFMGTSVPYLIASAAFRFFRPPVVLGSAAMVWGYIKSAWQRKPRYGDAEFRRFLRAYQWACLIHGKPAATESINRRQAAVWSAAQTPSPAPQTA